MQNNKTLKDKYAHLEFSILPLSKALKDNETKRLDSEYFKKEYLENEELLKRFECQVLGEICNKICNGSTPENGDFEKEGIPFFRSQDFNLLDTEPNQYITADFHNTLLRSKVKHKDILIAIIGATLGKIGFVRENITEANINQNIAKISINNDKFNSYFVATFLDTYYGQYQIFRLATQTAQEYLNNIQVAKIKIPLFDSSFQAEIEKIVKDSHHKLEQSKSLYKEAESLLYESLGSTNSACSEANSSLGNHCIDLVFSHEARTQSPLSLCKNAKNSTSKTADTRILGEMQSDSAKDSDENNPVFANAKQSIESAESTKDFNIMDCHANPCGLSRNDASLSSLRGQRPKQSIKSCEVQPTLAPLRGSEIERKGGSSASTLLELEADKARLSPKSVPKACKRSEAKTSAAVFRSAFASHQPLARCVGERGGGAALFAKKKRLYKRKYFRRISAE